MIFRQLSSKYRTEASIASKHEKLLKVDFWDVQADNLLQEINCFLTSKCHWQL